MRASHDVVRSEHPRLPLVSTGAFVAGELTIPDPMVRREIYVSDLGSF